MKNVRILQILDHLKEVKYCSMEDLQKKFKVSSATIHRDIAALAARGALSKMHGGVAYPETAAGDRKKTFSTFQDRIEWNQNRKQMIAQMAMQEVQEGDILFLDSSTTTYFLARLLENSLFSNLTIVTNSVLIMQEFHKFPAHYVLIGLGGGYDIQLNAFLGQATLRELEYLNISKAFISAFGVTEENVTTNHEHHADLLIKVLQIAGQRFLLADRSKFDREGLFKIAKPRFFSKILTEIVP